MNKCSLILLNVHDTTAFQSCLHYLFYFILLFGRGVCAPFVVRIYDFMLLAPVNLCDRMRNDKKNRREEKKRRRKKHREKIVIWFGVFARSVAHAFYIAFTEPTMPVKEATMHAHCTNTCRSVCIDCIFTTRNTWHSFNFNCVYRVMQF